MNSAKALTAGLLGAIVTVAVAALLPRPRALEFLALVLAFIAAVYLGFVLLDGRVRETIFEFGNIALTLALAFSGLWVAPYWLAAGYFSHGVWDAVHHPEGVQTKIPLWYRPFCLLFDWIVAGFIIIWWR